MVAKSKETRDFFNKYHFWVVLAADKIILRRKEQVKKSGKVIMPKGMKRFVPVKELNVNKGHTLILIMGMTNSHLIIP